MSNGTETNAANLFSPTFMAEKTITIVAPGGIVGYVASVPQCLEFEDEEGLTMALAALGYTFTKTFSYWPFVPSAGTSFAGGLENGNVPWLVISPVPPVNGVFDSTQGAFAVNAGKYADFWNHGVHPFVGSSYEASLRADISMRTEAAIQGNPNLG